MGDRLCAASQTPAARPVPARAGNAREEVRRRHLTERFWRAVAGFWTGDDRYAAWGLSLGLLLLIVLLLAAAYAMNVWNRAIFDALQGRDAATVGRLSLLYVAILVA